MAGDDDRVGALFAIWVRIDDDLKHDFDTWYRTEHLSERRELPGFLSGEVFAAVDEPGLHVALYELDSIDALTTDAYEAVRTKPLTPLGERVRNNWDYRKRGIFTLRTQRIAGTHRPMAADVLYLVEAYARAGHEEELGVWLDEEHSVRQLTVDGAQSFQGFVPVEPPPYFLNLWGLDRADIVDTDAWKDARVTPWRDEVAKIRTETTGNFFTRVPS